MINRFIRHLKEGFVGVARNGGMSISSATAISITLIIIAIFGVVTVNMNTITQDIKGSVRISALVDYADEDRIIEIENNIKNIDYVKNVEYSSKDEEFEYYISSFDESEQEIFAPYSEDNPFHEAFYIEVLDGNQLSNVAANILEIDGISDVNYGGDSATTLVNVMNSVRFGGAIAVLALSFLAIYLVQNTIKLTINARKKEIWIMRNVGARNGYIRAPFLVEGIVIGILGSVIPIIISIFGYIYLYKVLDGVLLSEVFPLIPPHPFVLQLSLALLILGIVVGYIGSYISVTRYLRWKR